MAGSLLGKGRTLPDSKLIGLSSLHGLVTGWGRVDAFTLVDVTADAPSALVIDDNWGTQGISNTRAQFTPQQLTHKAILLLSFMYRLL